MWINVWIVTKKHDLVDTPAIDQCRHFINNSPFWKVNLDLDHISKFHTTYLKPISALHEHKNMSDIMIAFLITGYCATRRLVGVNNKKDVKALHYRLFVRGIHWSHHKGSVILEAFPCHDVPMHNASKTSMQNVAEAVVSAFEKIQIKYPKAQNDTMAMILVQASMVPLIT